MAGAGTPANSHLGANARIDSAHEVLDAFPVTGDPIESLAHELPALRDIFRYAVSRFRAGNLFYGHGTGNAIDEAAFLILESLHLPVDDINPFAAARLTLDERVMLLRRIDERVRTRKPAPYLVNRAYIGGIPFFVDERTIVPRSFIGELLLSRRLEVQGLGLIAEPERITAVLDLCTGSGCLAILAAGIFPNAEVHATDLSADALAVARRNVDESGYPDRIRLLQGDLFQPVGRNRYDLILANPPYVSEAAMRNLPPEYRHEPAMALAGGSDGLDLVRKILNTVEPHLGPSGLLLCEIGEGRERLEAAYPDLNFIWLDTEESSGEVFCLTRGDVPARAAP